MNNENKSKMIITGGGVISDVWLRWLSLEKNEKIKMLHNIAATDEDDFRPINKNEGKPKSSIVYDSDENSN